MDSCRRDLYVVVRAIGNWIGEVDLNLTADKLYRDMTCSSSSDDFLSSIGISGVLPFGGLAACSREH